MTLALWVIFSAMIALAAVGLTVPLVRRYDGQLAERDAVTSVLRDQLAEIDGQAALGQIAASEAEALRTEIKRRLLVENRALSLPARLLDSRMSARLGVGLGVVVALAATGIYAVRGRPDLTASPPAELAAVDPAAIGAPASPASAVAADAASVQPLIGQLEARMAKSPNDAEGWRMLGWAYFQVQRFTDAAAAYRKAVAIDPKGVGYASALGEALVQAANGTVSPEAAQAFTQARAVESGDPRARYFLGVLRAQRGDPRGAIDDWVSLLNDAPAGAPWAPELRQFVEQTAGEAGVDLAGRLTAPAAVAPPVLAEATPPVLAGAANARGPTASDVTAAGDLAPAARQAFIAAMVDSLAAKLKANPRDADGWVRLIRARKVMGDEPAARQALRDAQSAFGDQPAVQKSLAASAAGLGVS